MYQLCSTPRIWYMYLVNERTNYLSTLYHAWQKQIHKIMYKTNKISTIKYLRVLWFSTPLTPFISDGLSNVCFFIIFFKWENLNATKKLHLPCCINIMSMMMMGCIVHIKQTISNLSFWSDIQYIKLFYVILMPTNQQVLLPAAASSILIEVYC